MRSSEILSSKPVAVEIVEPQGIDADALRYLRAQTNPAYFFTGMHAVKNPEQEKRLEEFVAQYSGSVYGDAATLLLGHLRFAQRRYDDARVIFEQLASKPNYPLAPEAAKFLRMIRQRTQHP